MTHQNRRGSEPSPKKNVRSRPSVLTRKVRDLAIGLVSAMAICAGVSASNAMADEKLREDQDRSARLAAYLEKKYLDAITVVSLEGDHLKVTGHLSERTQDIRLAEVPMWDEITNLKSPLALLPIQANQAGDFVVEVSRADVGGRDRLLSGWAVVHQRTDGYEPLSPLHYIDTQKPRADLPPARPRSIKGLGGCPLDSPDMGALGIASITLNIVLNDFITSDPAPGRTAYISAGRTWYIRDDVIAHHDRDMKSAAAHDWMVSAIILISPRRNSPVGSWIAEAGHPDAEASCAYVLPNFTTRAGIEAYAAALNFLAERYSRPDGRYGRIHHWIMHNEISSGYYWSNAGRKSLLTYLDLYQKSMRTAYLIARQYDPSAKALISLDHSWTHRDDPRMYPGRELLERLVDFSRVEGDFEWGIAAHPYAQDLFNPRTWEDRNATFDFNSWYVTFRNLEVLDAWVRQPRTEFKGREPREIQLTEEGLNSRDYSKGALIEQAAGLAYAWKKIERLKAITAFQYHLWADSHAEGGLRLGLRKFSDDPTDPLGKKPSWDLYRALGTGEAETASEFAKPIIGLKSWSEVHHTGEIH